MRARLPDIEATVRRDGIDIAYEVYDNDAPTILLLPTWSIVHSRAWKGQIATLARHWRVVTFDGRGNGRSSRPSGPDAYRDREFVADTVAVMDATSTDHALLVGWSRGARWAACTAAQHPDRADGVVLIAPGIPFGPHPNINQERFLGDPGPAADGWDTFSLASWRRDWEGFLRFFHGTVFPEPHSTKQIEDAIGWGLETDPDTIGATMLGRLDPEMDPQELLGSIRCPVVVLHAEDDAINPYDWGVGAAKVADGTLVTVTGAGHGLPAREPVFVNRLLHDVARRVNGRTDDVPVSWTRGPDRPKRVLYLSSPLGLGHVRRDLAIAEELRARVDDLHIDWLTQDPVARVVQAAGHHLHPASGWLASESAHFDDEAGEHDLHAFEAFRRMDEIMVANFHVFQEVVEAGAYDLVVADEAWDVDLFWHHDPMLKRAPLAWITDFVGFLPNADADDREVALTADHNAEMLDNIERFGRVRDLALFVGDPDDVVSLPFGPDLPNIRDWTCQHFDFTGYITGFEPRELGDVEEVRHRLGYAPDERVCIVSVGGTGVGRHLIERAIAAYPAAAARVPGLRMIVVAGPRIDPRSLSAPDGVEVRGYVPDLHHHLAVCDLAIVQGGLTTTMELAAARRPFLYLPLAHHFEQRIHVRHRLDRYGAGRMLEYDEVTPESLADAIADELGRDVDPLPVATDGAARAAAALADLL
jgi:pimeloyl-ACP methyl ester carboxylesterase/predicted glycosyltransferase